MNPPLSNLVARYLYPNRVNGIGWHCLYVSNDNMLALDDKKSIESLFSNSIS